MNKQRIRILICLESIIEVYTEYKQDGIVFHGHPNYNSLGEWYDLVMLGFAAPEDALNYPINAEGR